MFAIARIGDGFSDGDTVATGSGNVFADNLPVARLSDQTTGHGCYPPTTIITGSGVVFVNNLPVARLTDQNHVHCCTVFPFPCDSGIINGASGDVFTG